MDINITESSWNQDAYRLLSHIRNFFIVVISGLALCMVAINYVIGSFGAELAASLNTTIELLSAFLVFASVLVIGSAIYFVLSKFRFGSWSGVETTFFSSLAYMSLVQLEREMLREKCHQWRSQRSSVTVSQAKVWWALVPVLL